jgi:hypothetical protein
MTTHKFAVGDRVVVRVTKANWNIRPGVYEIIRAMPQTTGVCQYRAKNVLDAYERVFDEGQLEAA